jgi:hypothetical protein
MSPPGTTPGGPAISIFPRTTRTIVLKDKERAAATQVFATLGGVRLGEGAFVCHCPCPSHRRGDRNPSLSVKDGRQGRLLLHCFGGDSYDDIVAALWAKGLRL